MEIRHSENITGIKLSLVLGGAVFDRRISMSYTSVRGNCIRFVLHGASEADHDHVIHKLLQADPDATVRTARAVYEGLADYEAQFNARNGGKK